MRPYLILLLLLLQIQSIIGNYFCFPECDSCAGVAYNDCTGGTCNAATQFMVPYGTISGPTFACTKKPYTYYSTYAKWQPCGISPDISSTYNMGTSINITVQTMQMSFPTTSFCVGSATEYYTYFGDLPAVDNISISHMGIVDNVYFYQVRVIYGIITFDNWDPNTLITTIFATDRFLVHYLDTLGTAIQENVCQDSTLLQSYLVITHDWPYSLKGNILEFLIKTNNTDSAQLWGITNVIVSIRLCHPYCIACNGDGHINMCTDCDYVNELTKLSGATCDTYCYPGYGDDTRNPAVCILCEPLCYYCLDLPQNCLNCNTPYLLYPNTATNFSCVLDCPEHYYPDRTGNDTCMVCDSNCLNCTTIPTYCTACYSGTYLYQNVCYNICPYQTYTDSLTQACILCDNYCSVCAVSSTICSVCDTTGPYISYLLNGVTCTTNCGNTSYPENYGGTGPNICIGCDIKCITCTNTATNCSTCAAGYYFLANTCSSTCPSPYVADSLTGTCISQITSYVTLNMSLYWKNSLHQDLVCDLTFSQDLNWTTANITSFLSVSVDNVNISLSNFYFLYEVISPRIMRLTLSPKGLIFIINATFNFKTVTLINNSYHYATNMDRFNNNCYDVSSTLQWVLIKSVGLSDTEENFIDGLSDFTTKILSVTTLPYVQEIKKAGFFAFFIGGGQITSTACLVNSVLSPNFYQGVRFWASFIFFDVPAWEEDSNKTKLVLVPSVENIIKNARLLEEQTVLRNRTLFDTGHIGWRFERTGHTSFFIFDTYINIFLIMLCWILLGISHYCIKSKLTQKKMMGMIFSFTLKVHEISIFYITLYTILQWIYFDAASVQRWISFWLCLIFNVYFLSYQLYIYYDMINYPAAVIGNEQYDYYALRYGSLLKNIRFQEYNQWSFKHWLRPYNYHIISYHKKFLMMISLPLFYTTKNAQIFVLIIIQLLEIVRFILTWPFKSKARNIIRLCLQLCLMVFFITILIQAYQMTEIVISNSGTEQKNATTFYSTGWLGFATCWIFNIGHIIILIYDTIKGCRQSNRQMMDQARKLYYMEKLNSKEENQEIPLQLANKWVKLGNLNDRKFDQLPDLNLRVEYLRIHKIRNGFEIDMKKIFQVSMNADINSQKENNLSAGKKINKRFTINKNLNPNLYSIIDSVYCQDVAITDFFDFQYINIQTFQKVIQSAHQPQDKINLDPDIMQQKIQLETLAGQKKIIKLEKVLPGFPLSQEDLKQFF